MTPSFRRRALATALAAVCLNLLLPNAIAPARTRAASAMLPTEARPPASPDDAYRSEISKREYEATETSSGLQAPNRAHGLRTFFDGVGARVVDRSDAAHELARVRTVAIGRDEALVPLAKGDVCADGARVEIRRPGVVEWYDNSERGLEQGWALAERPAGEGELAIEVDLGARATIAGDRATIDAGDRRLEYGGPAACDADGHTLSARLEPAANDARVRIVVDDADASYPVTVDPGLTTPSYASLSSGQTNSLFGSAVAGAGDVNGDGYDDVIVGAQYYDSGGIETGGAFVFLGGPNGVASAGIAAAATAIFSDQNGSLLGQSVAAAGDVNGDGYDDVLVGAPYYTVAQTHEGATFVFLGGPNGIASGGPSSAAAILRSDQANGILGWSAAGAGDTNDDGFADVVVGAPNYSAGQTAEGAAFVFLGGPSGVASGTPASASAILQADVANANFGWSVHAAGDTNGDGYDDVVVGAPDYASGQADEGAAFVFLGGPTGKSSSATTVLQANQDAAHFGESVAGGDVDGDGFADVVVGANLYDGVGDSDGAAFVFRGTASGIANGDPSTAATTLSAGVANVFFGTSVDVGDVNGDGFADVIVGASGFTAGQSFEGGVFAFLGGPSGVANATALTAAVALQSDQANAALGNPVACAGDTNGDGYDDVVAGARVFDGVQADEGAAFVYRGTADGINGYPPPKGILTGPQAGASFGVSVAGAGDVNGDGFADVVVGARYYDGGATDAGAAFVFLGGPNGIVSGTSASAATTIIGDQASELLGNSVAGAGDVNGDGFDDVAVAAPNFADDLLYEGATYVFLGGPSGIPSGGPSTAATRIEGDNDFSSIGSSLAGAGDVDNDGYDDLLVGSPIYPDSNIPYGVAYLFRGGPGGIPSGGTALAATVLVSDVSGGNFRESLAGAGDVNGDGYDDVIVGASQYGPNGNDQGTAFVYLGGPSGIPSGGPSTARAVLQSTQTGSHFGSSVAGAGDVNADGYDDVVVGAPKYDSGETDEGGAFMFLGGPGGIANGSPSTAATIIQADAASAELGTWVDGAGDVNGDGYDDVVVGAPGYDGKGAAFVYLGGPGRGVANGNPRTAAVTVRAPAGGTFGTVVAGIGDVNRDGLDDFAVGAPNAPGAPVDGAAYVYSRPPALRAKDTPGVYVPGSGAVFLRNTNTSGRADTAFIFGAPNAGYTAISGDWDANGIDTPGLYDPATGAFFLTDENVPGPADHVFQFGAGGAGYVPIAGDWDGDGVDTVGLYVPATGTFFLRNSNAPGPADVTFTFGAGGVGYAPISGDWNGDGTDTVGLYNPTTGAFFLRNENASGPADTLFVYGPPAVGWTTPLAGDYDGDGTDTVGLYNPASGAFFLRNSNTSGPADLTFTFGGPGLKPLVGDWNGK